VTGVHLRPAEPRVRDDGDGANEEKSEDAKQKRLLVNGERGQAGTVTSRKLRVGTAKDQR
jgi:hypothetical protein